MLTRIVLSLAYTIQLTSILAAPVTRSGGQQQPFKFPLSNGFPNISLSDPAISSIQQQAHGTLPNQALNPQIADSSAAFWSLIAYDQLFQVAFFTSLLNNITQNHAGFSLAAADRQTLVTVLTAIQAQEEIDTLGANAILAGAGKTPVQPCEYVFPCSTVDEALAFAATFTDLSIGVLELALYAFGAAGDFDFLPLAGAIVAQKGERNGYFRQRLGKVPPALPLLTDIGGPVFAYSALQQTVIYPGSCPSGQSLAFSLLPPLTVLTKNVQSTTASIQYSFTNATLPDTSDLSLAYINQFNHPVVVALQDVSISGDTVTFSAEFPWAQTLLNGLTVAAVVKGQGPFGAPADAAAAALFGPGLIEVN